MLLPRKWPCCLLISVNKLPQFILQNAQHTTPKHTTSKCIMRNGGSTISSERPTQFVQVQEKIQTYNKTLNNSTAIWQGTVIFAHFSLIVDDSVIFLAGSSNHSSFGSSFNSVVVHSGHFICLLLHEFSHSSLQGLEVQMAAVCIVQSKASNFHHFTVLTRTWTEHLVPVVLWPTRHEFSYVAVRSISLQFISPFSQEGPDFWHVGIVWPCQENQGVSIEVEHSLLQLFDVLVEPQSGLTGHIGGYHDVDVVLKRIKVTKF